MSLVPILAGGAHAPRRARRCYGADPDGNAVQIMYYPPITA
jgi:hypothetical protein